MMFNEQRGKFDTKGIVCLFLGYYEGTKAYRLMCLQTKKIIKNRDVLIIEDDTSVGNTLKIRANGRNEGPMAVVVDESSKLSLCDDGEEREEQVGDHLIANEEAIEIPTENYGRVEVFKNNGRYPKRSDVHLESYGRITFYSNMAKNGQCNIVG